MSHDHCPDEKNAPTQGEAAEDLVRMRGTACPLPPARKESTLTNKIARTTVTEAVAKKVEIVRAKTGWDEKILRAPADLAVLIVSLTAVANLGVLVVAAVLIAAIVGAILFS